MLDVKALLAKILSWINTQGASTTGAINYGKATTVTPSRSGWLVARGNVVTTQTLAPIIRITQNGAILSEGIGLTGAGTALNTACYVRKGEKYTINIVRASIYNVTLY